MRILFILDYTFPGSNAPSNRIEALCKGFLCNKYFVDVICLRGTWLNEIILTTDERINVFYPVGKYRQKFFVKRNLLKLWGAIRSLGIIIKENKKHKISAAFIPVNKNILGLFYYILFKILDIKIIQERSEYPQIYRRTFIERIGYYFYIHFIIRLLDGMIVMTNSLRDYYVKLLKTNSKIKTIPMSVDIERFETGEKIKTEDYVTYCGDLSNNKDGVDILIKAFGKISNDFPGWKLLLIGGTTNLNLKELSELCRRLKIEDKVSFTGRITKKEIPNYLIKSKILALARPSSLQAQGGFPTKLGEYLATKNPVVVTDVGEISLYLTDNVSAYIAPPDSVDDFALKLEECIKNYDKSIQIGLNGYFVAKNNFDYKVQASLLEEFITSIVKEKK